MKRILFVDDEPKLLDGLRRMLRPLRHEWDMCFADGGRPALEQLAGSAFDVVVTDMRMPGMDGASLLTEVMDRYPATVRIILSGQCDRATVLKAVGPAHQFLTKPCDPERLKATVGRACQLRDHLSEDRYKQLVSRINAPPSVQSHYAELIAELDAPNASIERVGEIIARDPGLTVKVMQLTATGFFGTPQRCTDPFRAVTLFDLETVRLLASVAKAFRPFEQADFPHRLPGQLGQHCLSVAIAAREIARCETSDSTLIDDAYLAGLLHDIGILILAESDPRGYAELVTALSDCELSDPERRLCGASHADVGGYLVGLWGMPDAVVQAVAFHHTPQRAADHAFSPLTAVHVANGFLNDDWIAPKGAGMSIDREYLRQIGLVDRLPDWAGLCRGRLPERTCP